MDVNSLPKTVCYPTTSRLRFEPGPFCAGVQHANHSAAAPRYNYKTDKPTDMLFGVTDMLCTSGFMDDVISQGCSTSQPCAWL